MINYAVTLRKTRKPIWLSDYEERLKDFPGTSNLNYEEDRGLHVHFVITVEDPLEYSALVRRGWNVQFKKIYDYDGWQEYSEKKKSNDIYRKYQLEELAFFDPDCPREDIIDLFPNIY